MHWFHTLFGVKNSDNSARLQCIWVSGLGKPPPEIVSGELLAVHAIDTHAYGVSAMDEIVDSPLHTGHGRLRLRDSLVVT